MESLETVMTSKNLGRPQPPPLPIEEMMAGDYILNRFVHLPNLQNFNADPRWMAKAVGITVEQALEYADLLFSSGLWAKDENGLIKLQTKYITTVKSEGDFISLAAGLHATLVTAEKRWYSFENWVTSEEAVKGLIQKLDNAFNEFKEESLKSNAELMVAFNFAIADVLKDSKKGES